MIGHTLEQRHYQPATQARRISAKEQHKHESPKCQGCPYGDRQYCVGICWKDVYAGYPRKRATTVTITETTTMTEVEIVE